MTLKYASMTVWMPVLLLGCPAGADPKESGDSAGTGETGQDDDTANGTCTASLKTVDPAEGGVGIYYRSVVTLSFDGDGSPALIQVLNPEGADVGMTPTWQAGNNMVVLEGGLSPSTAYTVHVELCGVTNETHFTTSADGSPLTIGVEELIGRTYSFALADAEITEPAVLEMFDDSRLVTPLGFMVQNADATTLELLGGVLSRLDGELVQTDETDTWDFPASDFTAQPYFTTYIDSLAIVYSETGIPKTTIQLYNFTLDGIFAPDGSAITHAHVDTLVDVRNLGPLFGLEDTPTAVCEFAGDFAVYCIACPDEPGYPGGEGSCLYTIGEDIDAPWVDGLSLTPYPAE